jgi:chromobox protein 1
VFEGSNNDDKPRQEKEGSSEEDEDDYEVEAIVDSRLRRGKVQYLVKWKDWSDDDNTWEVEKNINCKDLLDMFNKNKEEKENAKKGVAPDSGKEAGDKVFEDSEDENEEYEVEAIVDKRIRRGKVQYLVKWKDWPEDDNTWEIQSNINCEDLINTFNESPKVPAPFDNGKLDHQQSNNEDLDEKTTLADADLLPMSDNLGSTEGKTSIKEIMTSKEEKKKVVYPIPLESIVDVTEHLDAVNADSNQLSHRTKDSAEENNPQAHMILANNSDNSSSNGDSKVQSETEVAVDKVSHKCTEKDDMADVENLTVEEIAVDFPTEGSPHKRQTKSRRSRSTEKHLHLVTQDNVPEAEEGKEKRSKSADSIKNGILNKESSTAATNADRDNKKVEAIKRISIRKQITNIHDINGPLNMIQHRQNNSDNETENEIKIGSSKLIGTIHNEIGILHMNQDNINGNTEHRTEPKSIFVNCHKNNEPNDTSNKEAHSSGPIKISLKRKGEDNEKSEDKFIKTIMKDRKKKKNIESNPQKFVENDNSKKVHVKMEKMRIKQENEDSDDDRMISELISKRKQRQTDQSTKKATNDKKPNKVRSTEDDPEEEYEVQKIVDKRIKKGGKVEYLIKWKGCKKNSWELKEDIHKDLVTAYEKSKLSEKEEEYKPLDKNKRIVSNINTSQTSNKNR